MRILRLLSALLLSAVVMAQQPASIELQPSVLLTSSDQQGVRGCEFLWREHERLQQVLRDRPELLLARKAESRAAWNWQVGDTTSWWATDLAASPQREYLVKSTCRAVGINAYIFVEDDMWSQGRVNQAAVDSVRAAFDLRTPANPTKGIFQTNVETFGNPPNVDNDPRIIILILDIKDGYTGSGSYVAGYFYSLNQFPDGTFQGRRSNFAEIMYIDANPLNLTTPGGLNFGMQVVAHEFQHMIHFNYDPQEITFVNEGCSMMAEVVCGYPLSNHALYFDRSNTHLISWGGELSDYARSQRWTLYLWDQFPGNFLRLLVQSTQRGIEGINDALSRYTPTTDRRFLDIFSDWVVANALNDRSVDPRYGYSFAGNLVRARGTVYVNPNTGMQSGALDRLAASYFTFTAGEKLSLRINSASTSLIARAVAVGSAAKKVSDIPINTDYSEPAFGSTYTSITVVLHNVSQTASLSYSYQASGEGAPAAVELKWDETEPIGFLRLSPRDTVCVTFDAVAGARLDSVRVALRRAGEVRGGVWQFTGQVRPSPLGVPLAKPITASTTLTPPVINLGGTYPYEIPYRNWQSIDLRQYNIRTDQAFVVGFWLEADTTNDARVMVTRYASDGPYHSYTYLNQPSSGSPDWYYLSAGEGQIYLYLIRAYASFTTTALPPTIPVLLAPSDRALRQPTTVKLEWSPAAGAERYHLQVATVQDFSARVFDDSTLTAPSHELSGLRAGTTYYWRVRARNAAGSSAFSAARSFTTATPIPTSYALRQNYPNPFNAGTTIAYDVPERVWVSVRVYDLLGRHVATISHAIHEPGTYEVPWNATDLRGVSLPSGIYVYRLESATFRESRRMVILR